MIQPIVLYSLLNSIYQNAGKVPACLIATQTTGQITNQTIGQQMIERSNDDDEDEGAWPKKLFLDANVLFTAAHRRNGKAALVIELGKRGHWRCLTSPYALEEAQRNLEMKYPAAAQSLHSITTPLELQKHRPDLDFPAGLPAKDQPIFQAALACGADFLLTGDLRHFGSLMHRPQHTFGVHVTTVADFLDLQLSAC